MNGKAWANRHYQVWVAPTTRKHLTPGRVLFRTPTELVANRMWMEGDITWTIIVGKEQRRPFQSRTGGRQEELEGLRKSLMEGRRLAEQLRSTKSEPAREKEEPRDTDEKRKSKAPNAKKEHQEEKVTAKIQKTRLKKEDSRSAKKERRTPSAVE